MPPQDCFLEKMQDLNVVVDCDEVQMMLADGEVMYVKEVFVAERVPRFHTTAELLKNSH